MNGSAFARTNIKCTAGANALQKGGKVDISVAAATGTFDGQLASRAYDLRIHAPHSPFEVELVVAGTLSLLPEMNSLAELDYAENGWFFVKGLTGGHKGGVVVVKTPSIE